jgi:hypothetical protein
VRVSLSKLGGDFFEMFLNESVLEIVSKYFGIVPYLKDAFFRRSYPSHFPFHNNHWHRDRDSIYPFLKVFFILNDVNLENGIFRYLKKSFLNEKTIKNL